MRASCIRPIFVSALAAAVALPSAASAYTRPCQPEVTDVAGDAVGFDGAFVNSVQTPNNPQLDLRSVDLSSTATTLTALITLEQLDLIDATSPNGRTYYVNFSHGFTSLYLAARLDPVAGAIFRAGRISEGRENLGAVTGEVDYSQGQIRITAPLSVYDRATKIRSGSRLETRSALAQRLVGTTVTTSLAFTADSTANGLAHTIASRC